MVNNVTAEDWSDLREELETEYERDESVSVKRVETGTAKEGVTKYCTYLEGGVTICYSMDENFVEMYYDHESNALLRGTWHRPT